MSIPEDQVLVLSEDLIIALKGMTVIVMEGTIADAVLKIAEDIGVIAVAALTAMDLSNIVAVVLAAPIAEDPSVTAQNLKDTVLL